jgi:hypothetical protein
MSLAVEPPAKAERMDRRSGRELANPPAISRSGAAACSTLLQLWQAYFERVMRITRSCAGTQSSISLTLSPMAWSALSPARQALFKYVRLNLELSRWSDETPVTFIRA